MAADDPTDAHAPGPTGAENLPDANAFGPTGAENLPDANAFGPTGAENLPDAHGPGPTGAAGLADADAFGPVGVADLTDAVGTVHAVAGPDARIVSLVPSITELLCDLGLAHELVGRTRFCIHPSALVDSIPVVGGTKDVDIERVRALAPTHVIVNVEENRRETAAALAEFVPDLIVTAPRAPVDNLGLYRLLGAIFGRQDEAALLTRQFKLELQALQRQPLPERRVVCLIWRHPWMMAGPDTYIAAMLGLLHWRIGVAAPAGAATAPYPRVDPASFGDSLDRVLLSTEPYRFGRHYVEELQVLLPDTPVSLIDGEMLAWYGSRAIPALRYLANYARAAADA